MLFNSYEFLFVFFPAVLIGFFAIGRFRAGAAAGFLAIASLVFYAWWSVAALPLLLGSIAFNYAAGSALVPAPGRPQASRGLLAAALAANLALLAVFKYAGFFVDNVNEGLQAAGLAPWPPLRLALPIGISFYTFTQIAFLVDCWRGLVRERRFIHYLLFVTYFPHLIAGPVLHHAQMMPQFADPATYRPDASKIALGLAIFVFGLAKKLLLADPLGQGANLVFGIASHGEPVSFGSAWFGVLSYALQIYFDFSGYSDMAIGISLAFGVRLPINFDAPYKSTSIIEFWRRWHISLSNFLRDYLYVPLGGNRLGPTRREVNLFATMVLGGLWHGAAWTFVLWGALHGAFLIVNHRWRKLREATRPPEPTRLARTAGWALTFLCVCLAWVLFRADGMQAALQIYKGLFGMNGLHGLPFAESAVPFRKATFYQTFIAGFVICLALPTTQALARFVPTPSWPRAAAGPAGGARAAYGTLASAAGVLLLLAWCISHLGAHSPFLYFQF